MMAANRCRLGRTSPGHPRSRWLLRRAALSTLAWAAAGCTPPGGAGADATSAPHATAGGSEAGSGDAGATSSTDGGSGSVVADWRAAARVHDWQRAHELLVALPEQERQKPEIRLALGRVSLALGKDSEAVVALTGLSQKLPAVGELAQVWFAEAAAAAGPYDKAAGYLEKSPRIGDLVTAARAYQRGGNAKAARQTIDEAVRRAQRLRRTKDEMRARAFRADLGATTKDHAVALLDWRWLVTTQPASPAARAGLDGIARLGGALSLDARLTCLARSTDRTNLAETLAKLDALAKTNKKSKAAIALARAQAFYRARQYEPAAKAYDAAASLSAARRAECEYYAARATARSGNDEDALTRYAKLARSSSKAIWVQLASFRRAQTLLYVGQYDAAAKAFASYLARFPKTKSGDDARFGLALAQLSSGKAQKARKALRVQGKKASSRWLRGMIQHVEGVAAWRSGDKKGAIAIWLGLVRSQPLTFPALAAHARLQAVGHKPLPPQMSAALPQPDLAMRAVLPPGPGLLHSLGLDTDAEQQLSLIEQEAAARYEGRESEALCAMYGQLAGAYRRYKVGSRAVSYATLMSPPSAQQRWTWSCVYPEPYRSFVRREEVVRDVPRGLVHAIMRQESAFRATVISPAGAMGLMQLMPNTASLAAREASLPLDPSSVDRPEINIRLGTFYIGKLLRNFGGSVPLALAGYNAGPHAAKRWLACTSDRETDLWIARIPFRETRHYVVQVLGNFARYQWLTDGTAAVTPLPLELPETIDIGQDAY